MDSGYRAPRLQRRAARLARAARWLLRLAHDRTLWGYAPRLVRDQH